MFGVPHIVLFIVYTLLLCYSFRVVSTLKGDYRLILLLNGIIGFGEGLSLYLSIVGKAHYIFLLLQVLIFMGTFFYFIMRQTAGAKRAGYLLLCDLFLFVWCLGLLVYTNKTTWPSFVFLTFMIFIIGLTLSGMLKLLREHIHENIFRNSLFWFYGANFSFYCFSLLLFSLRSTEKMNRGQNLHNDLIIYGNIILYLAMIYSVHLEVKKQRSL